MLKIFPVDTGTNLEIARELFEEYEDSLGFDLDFQNFQEELANLPGQYAPPDGCILLAEYEGNMAGCVALRKLSDGVCEMKRLFVREKFRLSGIGRALAESVIEKAKEIGYGSIRLDTVPSMEEARNLYISLGFKEICPYRYNPIEGAKFMELELV